MNRRKLLLAAITGFIGLSLAKIAHAFTVASQSIVYWGYDGVTRSKQWVGPDGTLNLQSLQKEAGTRIILYPNATDRSPQTGPISEFVIYGASDQAPGHPETNFERFSITQMNQYERMVRFTMERGGNGQFREMWFGYDVEAGGVPYFPLRITPQGVFVADINGRLTKLGG